MFAFVCLMSPDGTVIEINRAALEMAGLAREEVIGRRVTEIRWLRHSVEARDLVLDATRRAVAGEVVRLELPVSAVGERLILVDAGFSPLRDESGRITRVVATGVDVTERRRAEVAARESEARLKILTSNARAGLVLLSPERRYMFANAAYAEILGLPGGEILGMRVADVLAGIYETQIRPNLDRAFAGEQIAHELTRRMDDSIRHYSVKYEPVMAGSTVSHVVVVILETTEQKLAEERLLLSEEMFSKAFSNNPAAIALTRLDDGLVLDVNETWLEMCGETRDSIIGRSARHMWPTMEEARKFVADLLEKGTLHGWEQPFRKKTGEAFVTQISAQVLKMGEETVILSTLVDITERKRAEQHLRISEERFRELAETIEDVFWISDLEDERLTYISPAYEKVWGRSCKTLYDSPSTWLDAIHPDDRERVMLAAAAKRATATYREEYRIVRPDGQERWIRDQGFPVFNNDGEVIRVVGVARDVTERRQLEEQLRQAQKMDAIGQLAGGVAHDFNNILAAMVMQAHLAVQTGGVPEPARELIEDMRAGCMRAADLTRQLLAFGRRQVILSRLLDLNEVVVQLNKMLRRIVSENVGLNLALHPEPVMTVADAGMLDQVLLNLVINARDAMPDGGLITLETSVVVLDEVQAESIPDVQPGTYACLTVSDKGCGIAPEIMSRIFEPFFTTKDVGKGVGLGLATVFGIVKQHGGAIHVESGLGRGTVFRIYLPASTVLAPLPEKAAGILPLGGDECILLVEDDVSVRMVTRMVLADAGYRVLEAPHGVEAQEIWRRHGAEIDLLITDMIMPQGISGHELASRLQASRHTLKVIFSSGYSPEIAGRELSLHEGQNFLQKPYDVTRLLDAVRRSLDG